MTYQSFKSELLQRYPVCECCGFRKATEVHHCLYHRIKGRDELDCIQNCSAVCHHCHMDGKVNSYEYQVKHWEKRRLEGFDMARWLDNLGWYSKEYWGK